MDNRTKLHLSTADENRSFATTLGADHDMRSASLRWAAVVAFYDAVHYVNAYLWERLGIEPVNHNQRVRFIGASSELRSVRRHYIRLQAAAFDARYVAAATISPEVAHVLVNQHLDAVRVAVLRSLGNDA